MASEQSLSHAAIGVALGVMAARGQTSATYYESRTGDFEESESLARDQRARAEVDRQTGGMMS